MRVGAVQTVGVGQAHLVEQGMHFALYGGTVAVAPFALQAAAHWSCDLSAKGHERVQSGQRLLKHAGDNRAAQPAQAPLGRADDLFAFEGDAACRADRGRQKAQNGKRGEGFSRPAFPDEAEAFTAGDGEGEILDQHLVGGGEGEVVNG